MSIGMQDTSGQLRPRSDFEEALEFVNRRAVLDPLKDPELTMQVLTL